MANRILASTLVALAIACAGASCQRATGGAPCPCLSGYQCCPAEQACYPEEMRCPSAVPGALIWTADGVPTFDRAGNVYVDREESITLHAISLLDKGSGVARWTQRGSLWIRCSTADVAVLLDQSDDVAGPRLIGVSTADGTQRWSIPLTSVGDDFCSDSGEEIYTVHVSAGASILNVYATRDGRITRRVPLTSSSGKPVVVHGVHDNVVLVSWQVSSDEPGEFVIEAVELPDNGEGSIRWTTHLPVMWAELWLQDPDRIFALTSDVTGRPSLVRLAETDGAVAWTHRTASFTVDRVRSGRSPGIVVLTEGPNLVAVAEDTGEVRWTLPLTERDGYADGWPQIVPSGDVLIQHASEPVLGSAIHKLVGADGRIRWTFGPVDGSLTPTDRDEYYLVYDGVLSQVRPESGVHAWSYAFEEDPAILYLPEITGYDDTYLFARVASHDCGSPCFGGLAAVARKDGTPAWSTDGLFPPQDVVSNRVGERVYAFVDDFSYNVRVGKVWAFWR
jgi:outer membrane protein assembly factor BamB